MSFYLICNKPTGLFKNFITEVITNVFNYGEYSK